MTMLNLQQRNLECIAWRARQHDGVIDATAVGSSHVEITLTECLRTFRVYNRGEARDLLDCVSTGELKMTTDLNDCDTPESLPDMLREAAHRFRESEAELQHAWQDKSAGRIWREFGKILDRAADSANKAIEKYV